MYLFSDLFLHVKNNELIHVVEFYNKIARNMEHGPLTYFYVSWFPGKVY
jgi:hypothetical protein